MRQIQVVGHGHGAHVVEEALKQVAEHVGEAGGCLEGRQREGELGVHEGELRTLGVVGVAGFAAQLVVGNNRVLRRLAAGGRDGEHHGNGQHIVVEGLGFEELPHVAFHASTVGDGLRGVDDRTATHREHPVDVSLLAEAHALAHKGDLGVRAHTAQLQVLDARSIQRRTHAVDKSGGHSTPAAEVHEHPLGASCRQLLTHLLFSPAPEDKMRGGNEFEVFHGSPFCFSTRRRLIVIAAPSPSGAFSNHTLC